MRSTLCNYICVVFFVAFTKFSAVSTTTLKLVQIVWRHGDRTPLSFMPSDTNNTIDSWYMQSSGELTPLGMWQHFQLGQFLRRRYVHDEKFLSEDYSAYEVVVRSTNYNRTLVSAMSNFAGFYYNSSNSTVEPQLWWQPVPIHTVPDPLDYVLDVYCDKYDYLSSQRMKDADYIQHDLDNKDFFKWLSDVSGYAAQNITLDTDGIEIVSDPIECEFYPETHPLPLWANESVVKKIIDIHRYLDVEKEYYPTYVKYCSGTLLYEMVEHMLTRIGYEGRVDPDPRVKYYAYSAHDDNVEQLLTQFEAFNNIHPPYASAVIVELHQIGDDYVVRVFYRNTTSDYLNDEPYPITVGGCGSTDCLLELFAQRSANWTLTPDNWQEECAMPEAHEPVFKESKRAKRSAEFSDYMSEPLIHAPELDEYRGTVTALTITTVTMFVACVAMTVAILRVPRYKILAQL